MSIPKSYIIITIIEGLDTITINTIQHITNGIRPCVGPPQFAQYLSIFLCVQFSGTGLLSGSFPINDIMAYDSNLNAVIFVVDSKKMVFAFFKLSGIELLNKSVTLWNTSAFCSKFSIYS